MGPILSFFVLMSREICCPRPPQAICGFTSPQQFRTLLGTPTFRKFPQSPVGERGGNALIMRPSGESGSLYCDHSGVIDFSGGKSYFASLST